MRVCQLCGAASWKMVIEAEKYPAPIQHWMVPGKEYVTCDNCGSVARLEDKTEPARHDPIAASLYGLPNPFKTKDEVAEALKEFSTRFPPPETRTERLVRAMLAHPEDSDTAKILVDFARQIERELDAPLCEPFAASEAAAPGGLGQYAVIRWGEQERRGFNRRDDLQQWLLHGLDQAKELMVQEGAKPEFNINRLAFCFLQWLDNGAPIE